MSGIKIALGTMLTIIGGITCVVAFIGNKYAQMLRPKMEKWARKEDLAECREERASWEWFDTITCFSRDMWDITGHVQDGAVDMYIGGGILLLIGLAISYWASRG